MRVGSPRDHADPARFDPAPGVLVFQLRHQAFWFSNCKIQNIVAKTCVVTGPGERLDIDLMYAELNNLCTFQKTMFPGLIYRPLRSPVVLLCFQSGKVVITGGRTVRDVELGWRMLWPQVRKFIVSAAATA